MVSGSRPRRCKTTILRALRSQLTPVHNLANRCVTGTARVDDLVRMVRDAEDGGCCVDTSMIVSSGEVFGEVLYERDWVLVFRQEQPSARLSFC